MVDPSGRPANRGLERVLTQHQLPREFLLHLDNPPLPPARPRPSATLVLIREGAAPLEVLLLRRSPRSGFIPGAWVFPGGTVDPEDGDPTLLPWIHGITPEVAQRVLGPAAPEPPALAYWVTALRETFEETGILLCRGGTEGTRALFHGNAESRENKRGLARSRLLAGEMSFPQVLAELDSSLDAGALVYFAHWLTPECEPRRYETRFFLAEVRHGVRVAPHQQELVEALWLTPGDALARNRQGILPLVLPTLFTLEELEPFSSPSEALRHLKGRAVHRRLPRPERARNGVRFHLAD